MIMTLYVRPLNRRLLARGSRQCAVRLPPLRCDFLSMDRRKPMLMMTLESSRLLCFELALVERAKRRRQRQSKHVAADELRQVHACAMRIEFCAGGISGHHGRFKYSMLGASGLLVKTQSQEQGEGQGDASQPPRRGSTPASSSQNETSVRSGTRTVRLGCLAMVVCVGHNAATQATPLLHELHQQALGLAWCDRPTLQLFAEHWCWLHADTGVGLGVGLHADKYNLRESLNSVNTCGQHTGIGSGQRMPARPWPARQRSDVTEFSIVAVGCKVRCSIPSGSW